MKRIRERRPVKKNSWSLGLESGLLYREQVSCLADVEWDKGNSGPGGVKSDGLETMLWEWFLSWR